MTAQVCPNGAKRTKHHKQRPMQRTNSIQLLDTINATAFSTMLQPQIKPFSVRFSTEFDIGNDEATRSAVKARVVVSLRPA